jgi:hypothetical protein
MNSMKLRHAAALALVGWYLMVGFSPFPPKVTPQPLHPGETEGPPILSQWQIRRSFDSADKCEQARTELLRLTPSVGAADVLCIASDDPRLKEK